MRARERSPWRERVQGEKVCTGGRGFESGTRGVAHAGVASRRCHKREVQDPRSSQDTRRTRTRT